MIENMQQAKKFTRTQLGCSNYRKEGFLQQVSRCIDGEPTEYDHKSYDRIQDDIDALRRSPYIGIGL